MSDKGAAPTPLPEKTVEGDQKPDETFEDREECWPRCARKTGIQGERFTAGRVGNTERQLEDDCGGNEENPRGHETPSLKSNFNHPEAAQYCFCAFCFCLCGRLQPLRNLGTSNKLLDHTLEKHFLPQGKAKSLVLYPEAL